MPSDTKQPVSESSSQGNADIVEEVRLAVVMYGGSSLAIYINGVAQELFHLVRSTAVERTDEKNLYLGEGATTDQNGNTRTPIRSTERVYRKLAQLLGVRENETLPTCPVRTRFVVDILSGTSAGGINAVFLAKALANDQDLEVLKRLWLEDGALETLLNDKKTVDRVRDPRVQLSKTVESLLNSQRMYCILYNGLQNMEKKPSLPNARSPFLDELELYLTRTDIHGMPVAIRLSDNTVIKELQHRDFVHFSYTERVERLPVTENQPETNKPVQLQSTIINDLLANNDPFLAYASRCTSAFPFAFEPMTLQDIRPLAYTSDSDFESDVKRWLQSFNHEVDVTNEDVEKRFRERPFTDGGVLNNKPFGFATDTLRRRWSDKAVRRKLIYIEPSPQILNDRDSVDLSKPDAIAMVFEALVGLPGYQAIHGELQRVLERNGVIAKLKRVLEDIEPLVNATVEKYRREEGHAQEATADRPSPLVFEELLSPSGVLYNAYHRLKVEAVTDDLAEIVTGRLGLSKDSEEAAKIRHYLVDWRNATYPGAKESEFLLHFDLDYRMRRLLFLRSRINDLIHKQGTDLDALLMAKRKLRDIFMLLRTVHYDMTRSSPEGAETILQAAHAGVEAEASKSMAGSSLVLTAETVSTEWDPLLKRIQEDIYNVTDLASRNLKDILHDYAQLKSYSEYYEIYDSVIFPALYSTGIGEMTEVDILRISPFDAPNSTKPLEKLAGTRLGNFGALLQRSWRSNDIMWGRLDGA
ncbi:MAG: Patatin, partial [Chthonomonadales bacterium]|nr:Patatin [Chthonomonadales bacterium]